MNQQIMRKNQARSGPHGSVWLKYEGESGTDDSIEKDLQTSPNLFTTRPISIEFGRHVIACR